MVLLIAPEAVVKGDRRESPKDDTSSEASPVVRGVAMLGEGMPLSPSATELGHLDVGRRFRLSVGEGESEGGDEAKGEY